MSLHRRNAKRDANEKQLLADLRLAGVEVWRISGDGLPDVLVRYRGRYEVFEVKTATGRKTKKQAAIPWPIVRTFQEAADAIGLETR